MFRDNNSMPFGGNIMSESIIEYKRITSRGIVDLIEEDDYSIDDILRSYPELDLESISTSLYYHNFGGLEK